jgi:cell division protease FtsH
MRVALAGRIAEEIFCNDVTSGAQNDIVQVTEIAKKMVLDWGMSDQLGMVNYHNDDNRIMPMDTGGKEYSEHTAEIVDQEVRKLIDQAYSDTREILSDKSDALERLAQALIKYETLDAQDVRDIIAGKTLDKPTVGDLLEAEQKRTAAEAEPDPESDTISPPVPGDPDSPPLPEPG